MLKSIFLSICILGSACAQWNPNFASDRYGMVHLFEWHWGTIADECETMLAPNKIGGVQISPPSENRIVQPRPWWERYQPISYKLETRSGNRADFIDMVERCNAVGVHIYPDIVINHMCGAGGSGTGTGGTYFDADSLDFPGVPYGYTDFNTECTGGINYADPWSVRNCWLVGLTDLNQGKDYVRGKMIDFMNDMINIGVAGFRVDACKHMYPGDLGAIFGGLSNLRSDVFGSGARAYIFQEVIDQGGEPITAGEYTGIGAVTEFKYGLNLGNNAHSLQYLSNFGEAWGMLAGTSALVFINNHDNQRGHGGGGSIVTFQEPEELKILTAFMLAWPYGVPRVMSSYYFSNSEEGPPANQRSINEDGSCGNGWVCEHRWRQIKNMFAFSTAVVGTGVDNWWTNDNNQIAFSRGSKGFFAANNAGYGMSEYLYTGLPDGSYCNVILGDFYDGKCAGECVTVSGGTAQVNVDGSGENRVFAIYTDAMTTECNVGGGINGGGSGGGNTGGSTGGGGNVETTCTDCTCPDYEKVDCGELASTEATCTASGCLWCPLEDGSTAPWCFHKASESGGGSDGGSNGGSNGGGGSSGSCNDCTCMERVDCGELASNATSCAASGCLWCPLEDGSTQPWCFHPTGDVATTQPSGTTQPNAATTTTTASGSSGSCNDCTCMVGRVDCGELASNATTCAASGCLWCPLEDYSTEPWCFYPTGNVVTTQPSATNAPGTTTTPAVTQPNSATTTTAAASGGCNDCTCMDRVDCGELASNATTCAASGCLWCPLEDYSTQPWCFHPTGGVATTQPSATTEPDSATGQTQATTTTSTASDESCTDCNCPSHKKTDCGFMGIDANGCNIKGCIWCESSVNGEPWCFYPDSDGDGTGDSGTRQCYVDDADKTDCGYMGIDQYECEMDGCCWAASNANGVPWCYHQVQG